MAVLSERPLSRLSLTARPRRFALCSAPIPQGAINDTESYAVNTCVKLDKKKSVQAVCF